MAHLYSVHKVAGGEGICLILLIARLLGCAQCFLLSQEAAASRDR